MTISEVVRIHGLSERTVRRWITEGRLRAITRQGVTHVHHAAVELLAEQSRTDRHKRPARPRWHIAS